MFRAWLWKITYLKTYKIFLVVLALLSLGVVFIPGGGSFDDVSTIFTVTSFLYGILAAWIIGNLWSRLGDIKEKIADETGALESLYKFSFAFGKKYVDKVRAAIDDYLLEAFEYELHDYHSKTEKHFLKLFDAVMVARPKNIFEQQAFYNICDNVDSLTKVRNEIIPIASSRLEIYSWIVLFFLSGSIVYSLFYIKTTDVVSMFFTAIVSSTIILILLIIRDLNELRAGEEVFGFEIFERIFDVMGVPRYYPEESFVKGRVKPPPKGTPYRVGHIPEGREKIRRSIKLVANK